MGNIHARITLVRPDAPAIAVDLDPAHSHLIGRSIECDICVDDAELSRRHARLSMSGDRWQIDDLDSKNGVVAAGRMVNTVVLEQGACIGLGSGILRFEQLNDAQREAAMSRVQSVRQMTLDGRQKIDAAGDVGDVLARLLDSVLAIAASERGFALLTRADGDLEIACHRGAITDSQGLSDFSGSRGAVRAAIRDHRPVVVCDVANDIALAQRQSIIAAETRALVCLPLVVFDRIVGVIYADSREPGKCFTDLDVDLLSELAEHAAIAVAAAQLSDEIKGFGRRLRPTSATVAHLSALQQKIPDVGLELPGKRDLPATGLRWSGLDSAG